MNDKLKIFLSALCVAAMVIFISIAIDDKYKSDCYNASGIIVANYNGWCVVKVDDTHSYEFDSKDYEINDCVTVRLYNNCTPLNKSDDELLWVKRRL